METKQTLGAFICRRRKELGLTQREFADRLFVTESAVSKWERGMSYPDITMIRSICDILDISEHELLTASEDTEARTVQRLARRYLRLLRNYRLAWYLLYGCVTLACFLGDLLSDGAVSWFWIVAAAELMCASLTLLPALVERYKLSAVTGAFTASLLLLLLICDLQTGGGWFGLTAVTVVGALLLFLLPLLLRDLPLPDFWKGRKATLYLAVETAMLLLALLAWALWDHANWFPVAAMGCLMGIALLFLPVVLRQLPLPELWSRCRFSLYLGGVTAVLLALLGVCDLWSGGGWFAPAALGCLMGITLLLLPPVLRQLPLPEPLPRHKALLYLGTESALLLALLAVSVSPAADFWRLALPIAAVCLLLPWGLLAALRYLPAGRWCRAGAAFLWLAAYTWVFPWGIERLLLLCGEEVWPLHSFGPRPDFADWQDPYLVAQNVEALVVLAFLLLAAACFAVAWRRRKKG